MKLSAKKNLICLLFSIFYFLSSYQGWAEFNISVEPFEGGTTLRFGRVGAQAIINKEVKIRIISTEGKQYQVFQKVAEPFVNERLIELDRLAVTSYTIRGSNSQGTLYQEENAQTLNFGEQLLYTSNPNGDSDTFRMIYTVRGEKINASGDFSGKILYLLRPIGGGLEQTLIFNVYFQSSGEFKVELEGSYGGDRIKLTQREGKKEGYLKFSWTGNSKNLNIYQEIEEFPKNELNEAIEDGTITFFASGGKKGELSYKGISPLEKKKVLLYSSISEEDVFIVNFSVQQDKIENQNAGKYIGSLIYIIDRDGEEQRLPVNLEIEVEPVFKLEIIFPPDGMYFGEILPDSVPQTKEVIVKVKSNLRRPYMVMQNIGLPLMNEKGNEISSQYFRIKVKVLEEERGEGEFSEFEPVPLGDVPVFFSDEKGSSSQFKVIYRLSPYQGMYAGDYSTMIGFSLAER